MLRRFIHGATVIVLCLLLSISAYAADELGWQSSGMLPDGDTVLYESCEFGNFAADTIRAAGQTEIALLDNDSMLRIVLGEDVPLAVGELTESDLRGLLEEGLSGVRTDSTTETVVSAPEELASFLQTSGLYLRYDATAPVGERVMMMENADGEMIAFPVSVTAPTAVFKKMSIPCKDLQVGNEQTLDAYYDIWLDGSDAAMRRVQILGTVDGSIIAGFPRWAVIAIPLLACLLIRQALGRNKKWIDAYGVFLKRR